MSHGLTPAEARFEARATMLPGSPEPVSYRMWHLPMLARSTRESGKPVKPGQRSIHTPLASLTAVDFSHPPSKEPPNLMPGPAVAVVDMR
ncbi:hypothetical protein ACAM_0280 [Aeropyrum camini SY1 = JCM 12091]|uniref:Uncharacterized protein n=1 Tax=Aeropyrum camini SY1 = JCM 12091 TaxID=1198449 RepID=U3TEK1_9CREN|nr:hypothetical protein ACAM_0280 [Aeropyrum camini SY1 = JCM 12091]